MLSTVIAAGSKSLGGARFGLVSLLPGVVLATMVLATVRSEAYGEGPVRFSGIIPGATEPTAGAAIVLLFVIFLTGVLLQPFQIALVQVLEGYWGSGVYARTVGVVATELHRRRLRTAHVRLDVEPDQPGGTTLAEAADHARAAAYAERLRSKAAALQRRYPEDFDRIMPTMLGNVLRTGEDAAGSRYGLDAMTVYPRLYSSLSKPLSEAMARQLDLIALTAALCVSFALGSLVTAPVVVRLLDADLWGLVPLVAALLSWLCYRGAIRAAEGHGSLLATTFDLHRFDMLRSLHYELPPTVTAERRLNEALTGFLGDRQPPDAELERYAYDHSIYDQVPTSPVLQLPADGGGLNAAIPGSAEQGGEQAGPRRVEEPPHPPDPAR